MAANPLVSFLAWTFIPGYVTGLVHRFYYSLTIRAGEPWPQPGTALHRKHYQRIYIMLILAYLGYTVLQVFHDIQLQSDYYVALGVPHWVDEKTLKNRMRRLAAQYHPDKVGSSGPSHDYYVRLQLASEVLLDPVRRFAYDRFGPDLVMRASGALAKQGQVRDWLMVALTTSAPSYVLSAVVLGVLGITGYLQYGRFWRYWVFGTLVLLEIWVSTRPYTPWALWKIINPVLTDYLGYPPLLQFQFLALVRKMTFNLFIAISQLGPILEPPEMKHAASGREVDLQQLASLEQVVRKNEAEANRLLALDMAPFVGDKAVQKELESNVKDSLVQNTIRADADVRQRVATAIQRKQGSSNTI